MNAKNPDFHSFHMGFTMKIKFAGIFTIIFVTNLKNRHDFFAVCDAF